MRINWNRQLISALRCWVSKPYTVHSSLLPFHIPFHSSNIYIRHDYKTNRIQNTMTAGDWIWFSNKIQIIVIIGMIVIIHLESNPLFQLHIYYCRQMTNEFYVYFYRLSSRVRINRNKFYEWQFQIGDQFQLEKITRSLIAWFINQMIFIKSWHRWHSG